MSKKTVVIIGGGIAGTTCAEYISTLSDDINVIIITASDLVKTVVSLRKLTRFLEEVDVGESTSNSFESSFSNVSIVNDLVTEIDADNNIVITKNGSSIKFDKLCVCTGAKPIILMKDNPYVISIRDTDTVKVLQEKLCKAKKVVVIGNGGIALELVYEVLGCEVIWCIKHDYIGTVFLDKGAATFLLAELNKEASDTTDAETNQIVYKRKNYEIDREQLSKEHALETTGSALGPDWSTKQMLCGCSTANSKKRNVTVKYSCKPKSILTDDEIKTLDIEPGFNVYIKLDNNEIIGADVVVCAIGVTANFPVKVTSNTILNRSKDGGLCVDENMRTSIKDIYAAGDVCTASWEQSNHWFQMKLWTQGWQMGAFAGKCIVENVLNNELPLDFCFELFTHATTFFGYKVCLLGCFNGQNLNPDECEFLVRFTNKLEYIKLVMQKGRVQGAVLIGETDLEETMENLILNRTDVGYLGEGLLDPNIDIEDYFD